MTLLGLKISPVIAAAAARSRNHPPQLGCSHNGRGACQSLSFGVNGLSFLAVVLLVRGWPPPDILARAVIDQAITLPLLACLQLFVTYFAIFDRQFASSLEKMFDSLFVRSTLMQSML